MTAFRDACILSKQRFSDDPNLLPLWQLAKWHWWKVIASTIAFGVRALGGAPRGRGGGRVWFPSAFFSREHRIRPQLRPGNCVWGSSSRPPAPPRRASSLWRLQGGAAPPAFPPPLARHVILLKGSTN